MFGHTPVHYMYLDTYWNCGQFANILGYVGMNDNPTYATNSGAAIIMMVFQYVEQGGKEFCISLCLVALLECHYCHTNKIALSNYRLPQVWILVSFITIMPYIFSCRVPFSGAWVYNEYEEKCIQGMYR